MTKERCIARWSAIVAASLVALQASPAGSQTRAAQPGADGLLFSLSFDNGLVAERAGGAADPVFAGGVQLNKTGAAGGAITTGENTGLAWGAPGNIYAERGLVSFFWRPDEPVTSTPFPIFRVGYADHSSWDMAWLRIDWNGSGYDAFVTDTNLGRTRISFKTTEKPDAKGWTHIAFGWDERSGVKLWVDGKPAASVERQANYDGALFGFGPYQRTLSGMQVHSANNFIRGGGFDEVRIYDHILDDAAVAQLATPGAAPKQPAPAVTLADPATRAHWLARNGWTASAPPYLSAPSTRIRKVEFTDTRDLKEKMFRGADGIRETTWPGVYNRSRLLGRNDYFQLPDWNVYALGGKAYRLTLPDEAWNRLEIVGGAYGAIDYASGGATARLATRPEGVERTTNQFSGERRGGEITFTNDVQENPIQEIGAYDVTAGAAPEGFATFDYTVRANVAPDYPTLAELKTHIEQRFVPEERAMAVAVPAGAPQANRAVPAAPGIPLVHVLIPANFRDSLRGRAPNRFSYGWQNLNAGLDGVAIDLPALDLAPTHDGLIPLNIRVKDPNWPDRDLLDVNVSVKPKEARSLWLDTRDRFLPPDASVYLTIASAAEGFGPASLDGTQIHLVFKDAAAAKAEHVADRFEQARDNFAWNVEERPGTRLYPTWSRFEHDMTDLLRVDPDNALARSYWVESNPDQPYAPLPPLTKPEGVPAWAWLQVEDMKLYRKWVDWWIDERQIDDGEFGGGLSDDTDLVNAWVPLALMGVEPERLIQSQRRLLDATYANGMWTNGLSTIHGDELHSYEEGVNAVGQSMLIDWGNPTAIERAMDVARNYDRLTEVNPAGHRHFVSSYYSGKDIVRDGVWGWQKQYSFLITHPGLLLVDYNGSPEVRKIILELADGWLAHGRPGPDGGVNLPAEIEWSTDRATGSGVGSAAHVFWMAWRWTGDDKYLAPLLSEIQRGGSSLNANAISWLGKDSTWGAAIAARPAGPARRMTNTTGEGDYTDFVRWMETGDNKILEDLFESDIESSRQRMHIVTEGHLWSDRVALPIDKVQRTRMGGVAHRRNAFAPGNLVSWRFDGPSTAEDVGILIRGGGPTGFTVTLYNMSAAPIRARMIGAQVTAGEWTLTPVSEAGQATGPARTVTFEMDAAVPLDLPPGQTVSYRMALAKAGEPVSARPDIGISRDDISVQGRRLNVLVHSLGARATPKGSVVIETAEGRVVATASLPPLEAPADLKPRTVRVNLPLPATGSAGLRVRLRLEGDPSEVTMANNAVALD
jgi:hypothetical protein